MKLDICYLKVSKILMPKNVDGYVTDDKKLVKQKIQNYISEIMENFKNNNRER